MAPVVVWVWGRQTAHTYGEGLTFSYTLLLP